MGEAKRRGTREERIVQAQQKAREKARWLPALLSAQRDARWRKADRPTRRKIVMEYAVGLGIIVQAVPVMYVGPLAHLDGKTALMRRVGNKVLVQFDDKNLTRSGEPLPQETVLEYEPHARFPTEGQRDPPTPPADALGFGWHEFDVEDFVTNEDPDEEEDL